MAITEETESKGRFKSVADDLSFLARFHDRELDAEFLSGLRKEKVADFLSANFKTEAVIKAVGDLDNALAALPSVLDDALLDKLAAEYANIYLCHNYRIAPTGSVWLTEESLERQEPMFEARNCYEKYGLAVPDWRIRPDDHIVHELQFVAILCKTGSKQSLEDAVAFLDQCVLAWVPDFAQAMSERASETVYIASAALTAVYVEELRDQLETLTGIARPVIEPENKENIATLYDIDEDRPFVPGLAESW